MNGLLRLSKHEKDEMLRDSKNNQRRNAFSAMQAKSQTGTLDDFIEFLSENIGSFNFLPFKKITDQNKL